MLRDLFSLFPACAGVIPATMRWEGTERAFPRMCGGDPQQPVFSNDYITFSPHVRG